MAQQGDRAAFERLYARWNPRLVRAARRYAGEDDIARDLAQECWLGIWKGIGGLRDPARFRSYAFGVLHRRGADAVKRAIRRRKTREHSLQNSGDEQGLLAAQREASELSQAFAALPPDQRLAAHLFFIEGLTLAEIAHAQSAALGTTKSRLFHARRKLKAALT